MVFGQIFIFFIKKKTAYEMRISDWSSDVCSSDLWDMYLATDLETADGQALTGPDGVQLSGKSTPIHVLTAWNPGSATRSLDENRTANEELRRLRERHGHVPVPGLGCSQDRRWCEERLVVTGMTRTAAAELAACFGQGASIELTAQGPPVLL